MPTPLNRIIIFVANVQKCAQFYQQVFGFKPVKSDDDPTEWLELDTGGCRLAFHKVHGVKGKVTSPTGGVRNPHKIVFFAKNVESARTKITARGGLMGPVRKFGKLELCDGQDVEGHVFQVSNRR